MSEAIKDNNDYWTVEKNPAIKPLDTQHRFIPHKNMIIELGEEKTEDGKLLKFRALHYPKDNYSFEKVEQDVLPQLENCPLCNQGRVFENTEAGVEDIKGKFYEPNAQDEYEDTTKLANLPQSTDGWFTRNFLRNSPFGEPNFFILAGLAITIGSIVAATVVVPVVQSASQAVVEQYQD